MKIIVLSSKMRLVKSCLGRRLLVFKLSIHLEGIDKIPFLTCGSFPHHSQREVVLHKPLYTRDNRALMVFTRITTESRDFE
jgi:hypothetical protein